MARIKTYTLVGITAATASYAALQVTAANVPMTLTGAAASINPPQELTLTSAANFSTITFTVVGKDRWGNPSTEVITGPGAGLTVRGLKVWSVITSITPSAANAANTVSAGNDARTTSPWVMCGLGKGVDNAPSAMVSLLIVTGAADGVVETTYQTPGNIANDGAVIDETIAVTPGTPVSAKGYMCRAVITTNTGTTLTARFAQAGLVG